MRAKGPAASCQAAHQSPFSDAQSDPSAHTCTRPVEAATSPRRFEISLKAASATRTRSRDDPGTAPVFPGLLPSPRDPPLLEYRPEDKSPDRGTSCAQLDRQAAR